jgi:hypothetical protein
MAGYASLQSNEAFTDVALVYCQSRKFAANGAVISLDAARDGRWLGGTRRNRQQWLGLTCSHRPEARMRCREARSRAQIVPG